MGEPRDAAAQLADMLADLYGTDADVRRIVSAIGMRPAMIQFDARPVNTWSSVVREADANERRASLVDLALSEYPRHPGLLAMKAGTSAARGPDPAWQPTAVDEQVIGDNDLLPVAFLARGWQLASAVGLIKLANGVRGTGFAIAPDVWLTNAHVLPDAGAAKDAELVLGFQATWAGTDEPTTSLRFAPERGFATSPVTEDDWTAVRIASPLPASVEIVPVRAAKVAARDPVYIIQHPGGGAKQVALGMNRVTFVGERRVQYLTDTMPGSSGSPVFDRQWNLVALHHSGGWLREPGSKLPRFRNEGIDINVVRDGLRSHGLLA